MAARFNVLKAAQGFSGWEEEYGHEDRDTSHDTFVMGAEFSPTNAVQSLYGAKAALTGNVGAQDRPQEVLTPEYILEAAAKALGGQIVLDPCAPADLARWFARDNLFLPALVYELEDQLRALRGKDKETKKARSALKKQIKEIYLAGPGLTTPWNGRPAFVNHPFQYSKEWMAKITSSSAHGPVVNLCPVRPWRVWWVKYARYADECVWLGPVTFVGHKQPAPMPMCLLTYGCILPHLGKHETGRSKI